MARPNTQHARRADLVEAALGAMSERGLRALSLSDVAERAGLTRGAILYYYEDLDHLLVEAHRAGLERFCDQRDALVEQTRGASAQLLVAMKAGLPSGPDDALMRLLYEFDVLAGTSALHDELVEKMYRRQEQTYTGILETGVEGGDFVLTMPVEIAVRNLVALEDAYGLHIVAGNSALTVPIALESMRLAAKSFGAPC